MTVAAQLDRVGRVRHVVVWHMMQTRRVVSNTYVLSTHVWRFLFNDIPLLTELAHLQLGCTINSPRQCYLQYLCFALSEV